MAFKIIAAFTFIAVAYAGYVPAPQVFHAAPQPIHVAQPVYTKAVESYDSHPKYHFEYAVNDEHTGDVKKQVESRDGDLVQGEYSLIDSDGYKRVVQYTADHEHGFNAVVHREPLGHGYKTVAAAPVDYSAPTLIKSAPFGYTAAPAVHHYAPAEATYAPRAFVKTAPVAYAAAPAYPYHH